MVTEISWWPTATTLADSPVYARFAESNPFADPQHPAGYALILASIGAVTREVAVPIILQHLTGLASALFLFAATRRVTGSSWAGLLPAAGVLINPDQVLLEHAIMAESWAVLTLSAGLYSGARALDEPRPTWRWPLLTGLLLAWSVTIRTAGLAVIPLVLVALVLAPERGVRGWGRWAAAAGAAAAAIAVLAVFAVANATFGHRFGVGPSPGWYLYGRVAQFANCDRFTPPEGTEVLCEDTAPEERAGSRFYLFDPSAPAVRAFGPVFSQTNGDADELLESWARRAVLAQPGDYLESVWQNLRAYWVPSLMPVEGNEGEGIDQLLDFRLAIDTGFFAEIQTAVAADLQQQYYNDFSLDRDHLPLELISDWQQLSRFGATMMSIATGLIIVGFVVGSRRERLGLIVFGAGGLALILAPALTGNYTGRYTVPMAGPVLAGASIAIVALWRRVQDRRTETRVADRAGVRPGGQSPT